MSSQSSRSLLIRQIWDVMAERRDEPRGKTERANVKTEALKSRISVKKKKRNKDRADDTVIKGGYVSVHNTRLSVVP